jgi:hypothetical protein
MDDPYMFSYNDLKAARLRDVGKPPERSLWKIWDGDSYPPQQQAKPQQAKKETAHKIEPEEQYHQRTYQELLVVPRRHEK